MFPFWWVLRRQGSGLAAGPAERGSPLRPTPRRERCAWRRLVPGHKQPLTSPPPPRARPRWGRPSEAQEPPPAAAGPEPSSGGRQRARTLPLTGCLFTQPSSLSTMHRPQRGIELGIASISLPPTPITSNKRGGQQPCRAGSQPQPPCARRHGPHPHPSVLPRPVPAPSRSPPPRLPARLLAPRARSRAHPTPRLRACSITVPGAGLQASSAPELFEYANEKPGSSQ